MTLDEIQSQIEDLVSEFNIPLGADNNIQESIETFRTEYEPTVKMTKYQAETMLMMKANHEDFINVIIDTDSEEIVPELDKFWSPLKNEELMQAWLHPNLITIID